MGLEERELPEQSPLDSEVARAIRERLDGGGLACADAFAVARSLGMEPMAVGKAADLIHVKLARCQLGLFGYPGKHGWRESGVDELETPDGLEAEITEAREAETTLSCVEAWRLAAEFGISRMQMGWATEQLGVKISDCQLGAF